MTIWSRPFTLDVLNQRGKNTLVEHVGIEFVEIGDDYLRARMPIDNRVHQPLGILHGGASCVLAETIASTAGNLAADLKSYCVGLEINANHIKSVSSGFVEGVSKATHIGRSTQVWETRITQGEKLVCISRMTLAVLPKP